MSKLKYTKEYVSDGNKFYWNPDTLDAFKFEAKYDSYANIKESVEFFVSVDCHLEDGETEEMLVQDLLNQIYETNTTT